MSEKPKGLRGLAYGAFVSALREGDHLAVVFWLGLYLLITAGCGLAVAMASGSIPLDLAIQSPRGTSIALLLLLLYLNVPLWWIARNPYRKTGLAGGSTEIPRFNRRSVKLANRARWPSLLGTLLLAIFVAQRASLYVPRFPDNPKVIHIFVARFWDPRAKHGDSQQSGDAQLALIEAIESEANADEALRGNVTIRPLGKLISPDDSVEGEKEARGYAQRGHADLVLWGSVLQAESKQYRVRITPARSEVILETTIGAHPVSIAKNPCPPELSQAPLLAARFTLAYARYDRKEYLLAAPLFERVENAIPGSTPYSQRDRALLASYLGEVNALLCQSDPASHARKAIEWSSKASRTYTERSFPKEWALNMLYLGVAYMALPTGNRLTNLEKAVTCYESALRVFTERASPDLWAATMNALGTAHALLLANGGPAENAGKALKCYQASLRVYTERARPRDWARAMRNLGVAYMGPQTGDRASNLKRAIECFEASLRVYTERAFPYDWAETMRDLGLAYTVLPTGAPTANANKAIKCQEASLRVYTEQAHPGEWARTTCALGVAYLSMPTGDRAANLHRAAECFEASLRVYTERAFPSDRAEALSNIGMIYLNLPTRDQTTSLNKAIAYLEKALRTYRRAGNEHGTTTAETNLAIARAKLAKLCARSSAR